MLTDEQINEIVREAARGSATRRDGSTSMRIARAIEAECRVPQPEKAEPDVPFPGMQEAFEAHYSQSFTDRDWRREAGVWAAAWKAATRYAECQKAEPVAQEPVAFMNAQGKPVSAKWLKHHALEREQDEYTIPLYAAPQPDLAAERANAVLVPCDKLAQMKDRIAELEATIEAQRTLYANVVKVANRNDELEAALRDKQ